jgi:hypothetical protein
MGQYWRTETTQPELKESSVLVFVYWLTVAKGNGFSSGILAPLEIIRSVLQLIKLVV